MAVRVFAGAVSSALVLFLHTATAATTSLPLVAGFGFLVLASAAATNITSYAGDH